MPTDPHDGSALVAVAWEQLHEPIQAHLRAEGQAATPVGGRPPSATDRCPEQVEPAELVSVVVCTRNRADMLAACLERLAAVTYPAVEFLIVDNAPDDASTRRLVESIQRDDPRFRYECEPRPGLSCARNKGLSAARGTYLAYTDDDVSVDPYWVHGIVKGFRRRPDVRCVTGLVCTASITNDAESYFDARTSSWSSRCAPQLFDMSPASRRGVLYPYSAGIFGTGASFGFIRESLIELGGFDEALGAGTRTRGGEDLDVFVRVLRSGGAIAYEPSALVWHHHRADLASLARQMYGYGTGLTAFLTKLLTQRSTLPGVLGRLPAGAVKLGRIRLDTNRRLSPGAAAPPGMLRREFAGFVAGPLLYAQARRRARGNGPRSASPPTPPRGTGR
ncbi:glycosyltransferase [Actinoplanes nipponensis]|nr:glycosyltransferase [Actinoplanes nipponensis]